MAANSDAALGLRDRTRSAEAIGGLVIGTLAGIVVGFASARWALARDILLPVAIGASTIPLIAIAPILNNWFGVLNPLSKMMMAALLVFFPVVINVTRGLVQVQPSAAGADALLRRHATPRSCARCASRTCCRSSSRRSRSSTTLAFIGALVGEYFGGSSEVLGRIVLTSMSSGSFALAWAGIIIGAIGRDRRVPGRVDRWSGCSSRGTPRCAPARSEAAAALTQLARHPTGDSSRPSVALSCAASMEEGARIRALRGCRAPRVARRSEEWE